MVDILYSLLRDFSSLIGQEQLLVDAWEAVRDFLELGGDVLSLIGILMLIMWFMIFERLSYLYTGHPLAVKQAMQLWEARVERKSWHAHQIREAIISEVKVKIESSLNIIKALVAICPLMGLMGTVTGMIEVFDVMAISGTGNARSMAGGVSKATIPTMAGMVAALSGLFISVWLQSKANKEVELLNEHLTMDH